ncbi:MAG: 2-C-methyl-D-erythritol 4-phosphate cytidylyltransferase [Acidobacteriaceae bacterium]
MKVIAIIPAAGLGTRMAGSRSKQFLSLGGEPVLMQTVKRLLGVERVTSAIIALRASEMETVEEWLRAAGLAGRVQLVEGGERRQDSVANALQVTRADPEDIVLVHDAVRPLVQRQSIEACIAAVELHGAAIVGLPAVDTVKQVERTADGALISSTIPRERVVMAQTPQGFRHRILQDAINQAMADGFLGTDEASVVERAGYDVAVVMGARENFKITNAGDLELAEYYLARQKGD